MQNEEKLWKNDGYNTDKHDEKLDEFHEESWPRKRKLRRRLVKVLAAWVAWAFQARSEEKKSEEKE